MILARLLTSGKSLIGLQNATSRYRLGSKGLLPSFGSDKNPFTPGTTAPVQSEINTRVPKYQMTPAELAAARLKETKRLPVAPVQPEKPSRETVRPAAEPGWISRLVGKINLLAWWRKEKTESKPAIPNFNRTPVQTELSLDNVKVVRNDLSDADVEIVSPKATAKVTSKPAVKPKPETPAPAETAELIKT